MAIGVLAIQGDFAAHVRALWRVGVEAFEVRVATDIDAAEGLIIPGGESTTILKFIQDENLTEPIIQFSGQNKPIFGTCAGAILLAREVYNPAQASLGLMDIGVKRNGYGRQVNSFIADVETAIEGGPLEAVFIRAPRITRTGPAVEVLASKNSEPVLVRQRNILAATFHPELTEDGRIHRLFAGMVRRVGADSTIHGEEHSETIQVGRNA